MDDRPIIMFKPKILILLHVYLYLYNKYFYSNCKQWVEYRVWQPDLVEI